MMEQKIHLHGRVVNAEATSDCHIDFIVIAGSSCACNNRDGTDVNFVYSFRTIRKYGGETQLPLQGFVSFHYHNRIIVFVRGGYCKTKYRQNNNCFFHGVFLGIMRVLLSSVSNI